MTLTRATALGLFVPMLILAALVAAPPATAQATLTCTATATNAVGAHAGALSIRVASSVDCDQQATLEFTLPGGERYTWPTDAAGHFTGVAGDAYLCQGQTADVSVLATAADGSTWLQSVPIHTEAGTPSASGYGPSCDVILQPNTNFFTWNGPLVPVTVGLSTQTLGSPLSHSDNASTNPIDHISAVFGYDPHSNTWPSWIPGAPAFTTTLRVLVPGESYAINADADIPLTYPATSATPTPTPTP